MAGLVIKPATRIAVFGAVPTEQPVWKTASAVLSFTYRVNHLRGMPGCTRRPVHDAVQQSKTLTQQQDKREHTGPKQRPMP